jgi:hypothetical protein
MVKIFHGLRVTLLGAPEVSGPSHLGQTVMGQHQLPHRGVADGDLPHSEVKGNRDLGQGSKAKDKLAETEKEADAELGHGDKAHAKLPDGDDPSGHPPFSPGVFSEGHVDEGIAQESLRGLPLKAGPSPGLITRPGRATMRTGQS